MSYVKRTCSQCGYRDIQPNMRQIEIEYESGASRSSASKATYVGWLLGDKASGRAVMRSWFNSGKRKYTRKRKVWVCGKCSGYARRSKPRGFFGRLIHRIISFFMFMLFLSFMIAMIGSVLMLIENV
jgi:hypothetical protein